MGCDIHLYVEKQVEGKWHAVTAGNWNHETLEPGENRRETYLDDEERAAGRIPNDWFGDRNYELFAFLADVRNYQRLTSPICQPKGLPSDVSDAVKKESEGWGCDGQ